MAWHLADLPPDTNEEEEGKAVGGLLPGRMLSRSAGQVPEYSGFSSLHRIPDLMRLCHGHFPLLISSHCPHDVQGGNLEKGHLPSQKSLYGQAGKKTFL